MSWTPGLLNVVPSGYGRDGDPTIAFGSTGRLFYVYQGFLNNGGADEFISEMNPVSGGLLSGPFKISVSGLSGGLNDKPWVAVDHSPTSPFLGRLYVVWTEFPVSGAERVLTAHSVDDGVTWSSPLRLSIPPEGFAWPPHIATAPNGDVYISYHSQPGFICNPDGVSGNIVVVRSTDGGVSYPQKTQAFLPGAADVTYNVQECPEGKISKTQFWLQGSGQAWVLPDPDFAGHVYVVANDDPDNAHGSGDEANVYIARSLDFGQTWSAPIRVDDGPGLTLQVMPTAAIDEVSGCIVVMWYDNRARAENANGRFLLDVFYSISSDRGLTFAPSVQFNDVPFNPDLGAPVRFNGPPATTRIGEYIGVAMNDGEMHGVWTGNDTGQQAITDSALNLCSTSGLPPSVADDTCWNGTQDTGTPCTTDADCQPPNERCGNKVGYISITPPQGPSAAAAAIQAIQITILTMPQYPNRVGDVWWVTAPVSTDNNPDPAVMTAGVECTVTPHKQDWSGVGTLNISGEPIIPSLRSVPGITSYEVRMCDAFGGPCSTPLVVSTGTYGDVLPVFDIGGRSQPNFADINGVVSKFRFDAGSPSIVRTDVVGSASNNPPNQGSVNFVDINATVVAFQGGDSARPEPTSCP